MPLRIAYVVHMFPKVSETFIAHELAELRRRGVEVRVLSLLPPREELRHDFITASGLDELVSYEPADFDGILDEFKPDLLHAHFATEPTAAARELAARHDLPFTFTAHGYDIRRKPPADFAARAAAAQRVITVSEANAHHIAQHHGVPREHIEIIPCGVDTDKFCPRDVAAVPKAALKRPHSKRSAHDEASDAARQRLECGRFSAAMPDTPLIVCVARHVAVKNLGLLLDACSLLHRQGVPFRCVSIGDGPLRSELELKRARLGLDEVVEFTGALTHEEVLPWWQRADVAVLTSENEGMPVCLMEAAACGVPAVATAVGGIPELIEDGVTGLLAPAGDAGALASALFKLIEQPRLRGEMGRAARQRAVERFSLARQINSLLALWKEVVPCPTR